MSCQLSTNRKEFQVRGSDKEPLASKQYMKLPYEMEMEKKNSYMTKNAVSF